MDLKQYVGRRVQLTRNLKERNSKGHLAEELDGIITNASPDGRAILLKPRGSTQTVLIETLDIETDSIHLIDDKVKQHKQRVLPRLSLSNARQHLLMTHGLSLKMVNGVNDYEALESHAQIDHSDLGHSHQGDLVGEKAGE